MPDRGMKKSSVLRAVRPFTRLITVYNPENFPIRRSRTLLCNGFRAFGIFFLFSSTLVAACLNCWFSLGKEFSITHKAQQMVIVICMMQQFLTYISLAIWNRRIIDAIDRLQAIVDKRKDAGHIVLDFWHQNSTFSTIYRIQGLAKCTKRSNNDTR